MVPKLAESVEFADDDSSMTIKLRQGVKFSNGNDLTADDVLFTLQHMMEMPRTASMYTWLDLENSKAEDDYTVVLAMNSYDASLTDMLANASCMILDKETCEADPSYGWLYGTGPYKLARATASDRPAPAGRSPSSTRWCATRLYWGEAALLRRAGSFSSILRSPPAYAELQAGNLDAAYADRGHLREQPVLRRCVWTPVLVQRKVSQGVDRHPSWPLVPTLPRGLLPTSTSARPSPTGLEIDRLWSEGLGEGVYQARLLCGGRRTAGPI